MPLDRKIVVQRNVGMRNEHGEFVNQWQDVATVYATKLDDREDRQVTAEGVREYFDRRYRVRWSSTLAALDSAKTRVVDGGQVFAIANVGEWTDRGRVRRRFLDLSIID